MPNTLVIDTDHSFETMCRTLSDLETAHGDHHFFIAHNDQEALSLIHEHDDLDLAIVSIDGGEISGMDLFRKIQDKRLRIPRIALTAQKDLDAIRQAMNAGAADFLTKPVDADDLLLTINKVFSDCEARRQAWQNESQLSALKRELDIAEDIQRKILPTVFPSRDGVDISAYLSPAKRMSGDFYDSFDLPCGKIGLCVADVAGKGIPAAFFMAVVHTLLRATALMGETPGSCLEKVNNMLCQHEITSMFVSLFYCTFDPQTGDVLYSNGGHLPPYLIKETAGQSKAIPLEGGDGIVLGVQDQMIFQEDHCRLEKGDALFFYTDGVTEAFDPQRNQFSDERLIDYLLENRSLSAHALSQNLYAFVNDFRNGAEQNDDFTSLVIKHF